MALKLNVLVAEDDLRDQVLWDHLLVQSSSVFVHYVWSGEEVTDYLAGIGPYSARNKYPYPDILFLDVEMPRMNGVQVLEWLAAHPTIVHPDTYICTGATGSPLQKEVGKFPIKGYFVKPLSPAKISEIIQQRMAI